MSDKITIFKTPIIEYIYNAKNESFFTRSKNMNKLKKNLKTVSPDFSLLFAIGEFVRSLEIIYNYSNNKDISEIYSISSEQKNSDMNLFIKVYNGCIEYQLKYPNIITVRMHRNTGNKLMSQWKFADGECELVDRETEMLMERIIDQTMDSFIRLFELYYLHRYGDINSRLVID